MFFSFYFLNALQSDNNSNRVYVLGHKYVLGPSQTHFKMSLSRAQNIFMPANINSIVILTRSSLVIELTSSTRKVGGLLFQSYQQIDNMVSN